MSNYHNIHGDRDPYKDLKAERVEKDRQNKNGFKSEHKRKGPEFLAKILQLCNYIITTLIEILEKQSPSSIERFIKRDLEGMKKAFNDLKKMDCSQDLQYISHLSDLWHQFIEDAYHFKKNPLIYPMTQDWIKEIKNYPEKDKHSLGFYLEEYAGREWLPFPYMEMLKNLHLEYQRDPQNSKLTRWTKVLTKMINSAAALKKGSVEN